ncbi:aspartate/glutamate racemase family protein [Kineosporia sp. J2-2]|uniref:Aspartate/glutamate racemase family protein n=1 Tax=Kineosporia corallincola TaxID=2835133 RepID=A0ABS5TNT3_9ACTN|nr:aspartate/glutamate racemase family protein [Kineosporia corallincola]MBT0772752.1 aspartate/glutamate racemase family protein [Kineosporia corallincola]
MPHVVVINPTSSAEITAGIQASLDQTAQLWGVTATAVTSYGGPRVIESDDDARVALNPMLATAGQHRADAYVVGCFSDVGVDELRAAAPVPVIGIAEAALLSAMAHSRRIGVVSTLPMATFRHELYWARLGVSGRVVADLAIGRGSLDLNGRDAANAVLTAARELTGRRGAEAVILGSAGLAHLRDPLADELGVPVIEPCAAGLAMAAQALADFPRLTRTPAAPPAPAALPAAEPQYAPSYSQDYGSQGYGSQGYGSQGYGQEPAREYGSGTPGHGTPGYSTPGYGTPGHGRPQYGSRQVHQ